MKTKRIKALKAHITAQDGVFDIPYGITEPCYILRQSDVRALAEQMAEDIFKTSNDKVLQDYVLYALKRAGITPGKEAQ